jgi:hypothetical protein
MAGTLCPSDQEIASSVSRIVGHDGRFTDLSRFVVSRRAVQACSVWYVFCAPVKPTLITYLCSTTKSAANTSCDGARTLRST